MATENGRQDMRDGVVVNCVYLIECGGFVKIGVTWDLNFRLRYLQLSNPLPLHVLGVIQFRENRLRAFQYEGILHRRFDSDRIHGEWFVFGAPILEFLLRRGLLLRVSP